MFTTIYNIKLIKTEYQIAVLGHLYLCFHFRKKNMYVKASVH